MRPFLFGYDFYYCYAAGKVLQSGGNPYELAQLNQQLNTLGWPSTELAQGLTHPPSTLWLYWIMAALPFQRALAIFTAISLLISIACPLILRPVILKNCSAGRAFLITLTLLFPPILSNLLWGQINSLLLLGLSLFALLFKQNRFFPAGLSLSLLLFKPHCFLPLFFIIAVWELTQSRPATVSGIITGFLLQLTASYFISPEAFLWYAQYAPRILSESSNICGATIGQMIECELGWRAVRPLLLLTGILSGVIITKHFSYSLQTLLGAIVPLSLLVSPYAWNHSFVVLLPAFLIAIDPILKQDIKKERICLRLMLLLSLIALPMTLKASIQYSWIFLPATLFIWNLRQEKQQEDSTC